MALSTAVVGHVEWVTFARVDHVPAPGEIVHASDVFELPAGGGAVAAVQLAKLAGSCTFFTALGDDDFGARAVTELADLGVRVEAIFRGERQRRAFTHIDASGERTITVMGARHGPRGDDPLPWDDLDAIDAVYFTAGDDDALRRARRAKVLVATSREAERLARVGLQLDAVVGSGRDPSERYIEVDPPPHFVVETSSESGGRFRSADGTAGSFPPGRLPGPVVCSYGAGDSFAAGLTYGLGSDQPIEQALAVAADCGAAVITGRGPYAAQLNGQP